MSYTTLPMVFFLFHRGIVIFQDLFQQSYAFNSCSIPVISRRHNLTAEFLMYLQLQAFSLHLWMFPEPKFQIMCCKLQMCQLEITICPG